MMKESIATTSTTTSKPITWIVGASTGIGMALVKAYVQRQHHVVISARRLSLLEQVQTQLMTQFPNARISIVPLDINDLASVKSARQQLETELGYINSIIINAGVCEYISSVEIDMDSVRRVMETNFFGALNMVNASLPLLRASLNFTEKQNKKQPLPQLVFVSSSVTYQALPRAGAYGSSKAALSYFAESLKLDLQHEGIDVRIVSPGFVKTPLTDKNDFPMPARISAEQAAERLVNGLSGKAFDVNFPKRFTWMLKIISCLPFSIKHKLLRKTSRHMQDIHLRAKSSGTH